MQNDHKENHSRKQYVMKDACELFKRKQTGRLTKPRTILTARLVTTVYYSIIRCRNDSMKHYKGAYITVANDTYDS